MRAPFNEAKLTEAAALFLELSNRRMNYMKLIKLLYFAGTSGGRLLMNNSITLSFSHWHKKKAGILFAMT